MITSKAKKRYNLKFERGRGSPRNCRWGVTFRFLNGEAIPDENMPFYVRLYALVVVLKILLDFRL